MMMVVVMMRALGSLGRRLLGRCGLRGFAAVVLQKIEQGLQGLALRVTEPLWV